MLNDSNTITSHVEQPNVFRLLGGPPWVDEGTSCTAKSKCRKICLFVKKKNKFCFFHHIVQDNLTTDVQIGEQKSKRLNETDSDNNPEGSAESRSTQQRTGCQCGQVVGMRLWLSAHIQQAPAKLLCKNPTHCLSRVHAAFGQVCAADDQLWSAWCEAAWGERIKAASVGSSLMRVSTAVSGKCLFPSASYSLDLADWSHDWMRGLHVLQKWCSAFYSISYYVSIQGLRFRFNKKLTP